MLHPHGKHCFPCGCNMRRLPQGCPRGPTGTRKGAPRTPKPTPKGCPKDPETDPKNDPKAFYDEGPKTL